MISRIDSNSVDEILNRWRANSAMSSKFGGYTDYLTTLARGERQLAIQKHLRPFVESIKTSKFEVRYEFVLAACSVVDFDGRNARTRPVPGIPHDLIEQVAIPTLVEATEHNDKDASAWLWLAMLPSNQHYPNHPDPRLLLERAHALAPDDQQITVRLAQDLLHTIWFACHHLPGTLLAPQDVVLNEISALRNLAKRCDATKVIAITEAADRYESMMSRHIETGA